MKTIFCAAAALPVLLLARAGHAQVGELGGCRGPRIIIVAPLAEPWLQAVEDARAGLRGYANLDRCAVVTLEPQAGGLRVQVSLEDGRSAKRDVAKGSGLLPTLEGLLALPPPERRVATTWSEPAGADQVLPHRSTTASSARDPYFEVGLGVMGRVAESPLYGGIGLAAFAQANLGHWLFGVVARWDAVDSLVSEAVPSGFNMQTLAMGIDAGVRTEFRAVALDVLLGPQVRVENQEAFGGETAPDGIGGGTSDIRLDLALRMIVASGSRVRLFSEVDLDASPRRLSQTRRLDPQLPALPAWSVGLTLGALARLP